MVVFIEVYAAACELDVAVVYFIVNDIADNYIAFIVGLVVALGEIIFNFATSSKCAAVYIDSFLELLVVLSLVFFICSTSIIRLVVVEAADLIYNLTFKLYIVDNEFCFIKVVIDVGSTGSSACRIPCAKLYYTCDSSGGVNGDAYAVFI